jgi:hypothetical protein
MFSTTTNLDTGRRSAWPKNRAIARIALAAAILAGGSSAGLAQAIAEQETVKEKSATEQKPKWEFLIASGTLIPTGAQRGTIKRANLTAAQLSYVVRPHLAITSTLGWARSRDIARAGTPKLDIFTYDVGAEARASHWNAGHAVTFSPFAGGGAGARSYLSRNDDIDATHQFTPYVSAGGEFSFRPSVRRVHVRLEVRDYVSGLTGQGTGGARHDIVTLIGLRFTKQAK